MGMSALRTCAMLVRAVLLRLLDVVLVCRTGGNAGLILSVAAVIATAEEADVEGTSVIVEIIHFDL